MIPFRGQTFIEVDATSKTMVSLQCPTHTHALMADAS